MNIVFRYIACLAFILSAGTANGQGIEAGSWGGKVRAGPGMQYDQIGSLRNGDPVKLLEKTAVIKDGYPWFRISYNGTKTGYQWGGILCGFDSPIAGTFRVCDHDNRRRAAIAKHGPYNLPCAAEGQARSLEGNRPTTIIFRAVGENDETQFKIYWLDYKGRRKFYKHIFAGDVFRQATFMTHPWLVTAPRPGGGEDCLAIYLPRKTAQTIVLE